MTERTRVLLLFGGRSAEHEVSCISAVAAARALDPARYEVTPVGITLDGRFLLSGAAKAAIEAGADVLPRAFVAEGEPVALEDIANGALGVDVVFPLLHGPYGEDGTVQGLFELFDLPYVGSGVLGSAVGMDKVMMKVAIESAGLPVPKWRAFREWDVSVAALDDAVRDLGLPVFVKPANMGSSVGITKAHDRAELEAAVQLALTFDEWVIVEEAIDAREVEVAVLGDHPVEASAPGEIVPGDEFYSYADKYLDDNAQLLAPAPLTPEQTDEVRALAIKVFEACRADAMARVDFLMERTTGTFYVNEINTIPGFTPISMFPRLWQESGVTYPELLDRLIRLAFERHGRRAKRAGRPRD
ncbi:MAG: D-alanine--D-alanine ligase family protein [Acidimicrobiia bacterium]